MFWFALDAAEGPTPPKKDRFLTLYDSPRFPRQVWEQFRASAAANRDAWIDVLRDLMERHTKEGGRTTKE